MRRKPYQIILGLLFGLFFLGMLAAGFYWRESLPFFNLGQNSKKRTQAAQFFSDYSSQLSTSKPASTPTLIEPTPTQAIKILFAGDLMYDRHIRLAAERYGYQYPLAPLTEFLQDFDLVVVNLEGPITDYPSRSVGSKPGSTDNYFFTFDPKIVDQVLVKNQMKVVNLGNNHILNFGLDGYQQTINNLEQAGIDYFGQIDLPDNSSSSIKISHVWQYSGIKIGLVNFNQFSGLGLEPVLAEIKQLKDQVDYVFAYVHWGNEYVPQANTTIQSWAHQLVDAGADAVIGAHPHVIQNIEKYKGKMIYYSLGNFVFDQYFQQEVKKGMLVGVKIDALQKQPLKFEQHLVEMTLNNQTRLFE